jgi:hypothetical protein
MASLSRRQARSSGDCDAGKNITMCKRCISINTDGQILMIYISQADLSDLADTYLILGALQERRSLEPAFVWS